MAADEDKPVQLKLFDRPFVCTVCGCDQFRQRRWEVKGPGSSFLKPRDLAVNLICTRCGYVHWFMPDMGQYEHKTMKEDGGTS